MSLRRLGSLIGGLTVLLGPVPALAAPVIGFEPDAVLASGLAPGGQVIFFAAARTDQRYHRWVRTWREAVEDLDGDGVARLELDGEVPLKSLWLAVDLSGEVGVAAPEGFPLREVALEAGALAGAADPELRLRLRWLEVLWVRPGVGAWGATAFEGGEGDGDGRADDRVTAALASLAPVRADGPPAPRSLLAGDLLLLISPDWLEYTLVRWPPQLPGREGGR